MRVGPPSDAIRTVNAEPPDEDVGYRLIKGRRWRISDPAIPDALRQQLVNALMDARRAVKAALADDDAAALAQARARVHCAKLALGERGARWWAPMDELGWTQRLDATLISLLARRDPDATLCPSELARSLGGDAWRDDMERVRERCWQLAAGERVELRQRGAPVEPGVRGPLRIARGARFQDWPRALVDR